MLIDGATVTKNLKASYDVVVVGTGAGGAVVGKELAEMGLTVAFVEEGFYHSINVRHDLASHAVSELYRNQGMTFAVGNPVIPVLQGKCVGGTTVVNGGTCFRVPSKITDIWIQQLGLEELSQDELQPYFERVEKELNIHDTPFELMSRSNQMFYTALQKEGLHAASLKRNTIDCEGCGMCCYGCTSGAKQSMDVSYIPKAIKAGAVVYTGCQVTNIMHEKNRVTGVVGYFTDHRGRKTNKQLTVHGKWIIVSAGTINTPLLLQKSHVSRSPQLCKNLTIHPATKVYAEFDEVINGWLGVPQACYSQHLQEDGILFEGVFLPPDLASAMNPFAIKKTHEFMCAYKNMATFGFMIEDSTTGSVRSLPGLGPTIFYQLQQHDVDRIKKATLFLVELFLRLGAKSVIPMLKGPLLELKSREDVLNWENHAFTPQDAEVAAFHPLGTARMGKNRQEGVVDANGKVWEMENLYVCDGSIIPTSLGVNPQLTIMALATRMAGQIHSR